MVPLETSIAIGFTESSDMKHPAPDIGRVGTELPLNNFALAACCTTSKLTAVTGPRMLKDAKSIVSDRKGMEFDYCIGLCLHFISQHFAMKMPTATLLLENLATVTGIVKAAIHVSRDALPC